MESYVSNSVAPLQFESLLLGIFAGLALALATVGIYGVMAYAVTQRTHEIGIRIALGARQRDVLRMVLGEGIALILIGIAIGLAGAFVLTRVMSSLLYGVSTTDRATFVSVPLLLTCVALLPATFLPVGQPRLIRWSH